VSKEWREEEEEEEEAMSRDGGGEEERWCRRARDGEKDGCVKRRPQLISRGRARAWATKRSRHAAQHKRGPEEDLAASSVARLWARARQGKELWCARLGPSDVLCGAALSTGQPERKPSQRPTHPLPLPPPLPGLSHADNSCELETLPLSRRFRTRSSWNNVG
jgi:hypothetical protein